MRAFQPICLGFILPVLLACGGGSSSSPQPAPPAPSITSFQAAAATLAAGSATTLTAVFANGTGTVNQGVGVVTSGTPVSTGNLATTTDFTLTVSGSGSPATRTVTVTVVPAPAITAFTAPTLITAGNTATLAFTFTGGTGVVTPGVGAVTSGGTAVVTPLATTTYTLTVTSSLGATTSLSRTIEVVPAPRITSFTSNGPIPSGNSALLTAVFSGGTGVVTPGNLLILSGVGLGTGPLTTDTTFTLTVTNPAGSFVTATTTVTMASLTFALPDASAPGTTVPLVLARIPAGSFTMGSPEVEVDREAHEGPPHPVSLSAFHMGRTEITQAQWRAVMNAYPSYFQTGGGGSSTDDFTRPVEQVSYEDITAATTGFLARLNALTAASRPAGLVFRLPTEAEWEYAARAGAATRFAWGDDLGTSLIPGYAWYWGNSTTVDGRSTHPAGTRLPNAYGLYDLNGNVGEWCQDWDGPYTADARTDPAGPATGTLRVLRGGSWNDPAPDCRSASRGALAPEGWFYTGGFRVVLGAPRNP